MALAVQEEAGRGVVIVNVSDKLTKADYAYFAPYLEKLIQDRGKVRVLFTMRDFHGWKMSALWEDIKFDAKHFNHIERLAMVGEKTWQKWMAAFCRPFTTATIRYFEKDQLDEARRWIESDD